jgi:ribosomal protein S24E
MEIRILAENDNVLLNVAVGWANVYESMEQARLIEPKYIWNRNFPQEKPKEEGTGS